MWVGFGAGLANVQPADGGEVRADGDVGAPRVADLWPPALLVTRNNAVLQLRLQYFALPVANDHQLLLICRLIVLKYIAFAPPTTDLRPRTGGSPPVQQHAQACCDPPTSRLGLKPKRRGTRSRAARWRSAVGGALAVCLRTLDLLMGGIVGCGVDMKWRWRLSDKVNGEASSRS